MGPEEIALQPRTLLKNKNLRTCIIEDDSASYLLRNFVSLTSNF